MPNRDFGDLDRALRTLQGSVEFPATPDLAAAVAVRLRSAPRQPVRQPWLPRVALAAGIAAVAFAAVLVFSPAVRTAVADFLGIGGVEIVVTESPPPARIADELDLGAPTTLADAVDEVDFEISLPAALGEPDEVYIGDLFPGSIVSFVYAAGPDLPKSPETQVGLLLSEFRARIDAAVIEKSVFEGATSIDPVDVNGTLGYWIEGEPHAINFIGPDGTFIAQEPRLAGNTLVWATKGVTYRLESALTKQRALEIARSVP